MVALKGETGLVQVQETLVLRRGGYCREQCDEEKKSFHGLSLFRELFVLPVIGVASLEKVSGKCLNNRHSFLHL